MAAKGVQQLGVQVVVVIESPYNCHYSAYDQKETNYSFCAHDANHTPSTFLNALRLVVHAPYAVRKERVFISISNAARWAWSFYIFTMICWLISGYDSVTDRCPESP